MKEQKGSRKNAQTKSNKNIRIEFAGGDKCVNCGKSLKGIESTDVLRVAILTRSFPVCSDVCRDSVKGYIDKDKKLKKYMYLLILAAAVCVLIGAISSIQMFMSVALIISGLAFIFMPYPISRLETFQSTPVRTVKIICMVIGIFLAGFGAILIIFA